MANSFLVNWQGGSRTVSGASSKFLIRQTDQPYDTIPKTEYAFQLWMLENGYDEALANNVISSAVLYEQLRSEFFGQCGGGNGTLIFGIEVVRKDRSSLPTAGKVTLYPSWGYLSFRQVRSGITKQLLIDVENEDEIEVTDYYITDVERRSRISYYINGGYVSINPPGIWTEGGVLSPEGESLSSYRDLAPKEYNIDSYGNLYIKFNRKLIGTYKINIVHSFDDYILVDPMRPTANDIYDPDEVYDCTLRAFGGGDYLSHEVDIPDDAKECIQYTTVTDPATGEIITVIKPPTNNKVVIYNSDGSSTTIDASSTADGVDDDPCICWQCGGEGILPDCTPSAVIDCTCPTCEGIGILPGCESEDEEGNSESNTTTYNYYNYSKDDPNADDDSDKPYILKVKKHKCTNQVTDWELVKK